MRHGLQEQELAQHLVARCVLPREVLYRVLAPLDLDRLVPQARTSVVDWWLNNQGQLGQQCRKGFDTLLILGAWCLWKERNRRVFDNVAVTLLPP